MNEILYLSNLNIDLGAKKTFVLVGRRTGKTTLIIEWARKQFSDHKEGKICFYPTPRKLLEGLSEKEKDVAKNSPDMGLKRELFKDTFEKKKHSRSFLGKLGVNIRSTYNASIHQSGKSPYIVGRGRTNICKQRRKQCKSKLNY